MSVKRIKKSFRNLLIAFGFLTILPGLGRISVDPDEIGESSAFFPVVGLFIGLVIYALSLLRGLSPLTISVIICVSLIVLTRGMHADGVVDTFDGFLSGKASKDETLAVMKDPRLGALGFVSSLCIYLLKIVFVYEVVLRLPKDPLLYIALPPMLSRGTLPFHAWFFPPARVKEGLGKKFKSSVKLRQVVASFILTELFSMRPGDIRPLIFAPVLIFFWIGWGFLCMKKIGGITGDTMGAGVELAEVFSFILVLIIVI